MRRGLVTALAVLAGALALAPAAGAHAQLEASSPARGAVVPTEPRAVEFRFDESVEASLGALRVFDARGRRVDDGRVSHPGGAGARLAVGLRDGLPDGTYTATYRVISADGHPVSAGLIFSVGRRGAAPGATVDELLGATGAGPVTRIAFGIVKAVVYLATALSAGVLAFLALAWRPGLAASAGADAAWRQASEAVDRRARRLLLAAVAVGAVAGALGLAFEAALGGGTTLWAALAPQPLREVLQTRFGRLWGLRELAWIALGAGVLALRPRGALGLRPATVGATGQAVRRLPAATVLGLGACAAVVTTVPALAGHAATQSPRGLLVALDVAHVGAMSLWLGGLVALLGVVAAGTRRLPAPERTRLLGAVLARFSPLALGCVVILALTGTVQAALHLGGLGALIQTGYGRAVLLKALGLLALAALGALHRRRILPGLARAEAAGAGPGGAGVALRRALRAEVVLVVAVLGVTSALVGYAPPSSARPGPFSADASLGAQRLQVSLDPARVGSNELHLYLFDRRTGAPSDAGKEVRAAASLPGKVGALPVTLRRAGPGHYVADALALSPAGSWRLRVTSRVSDFDEFARVLTVPVR